MVKTGIIIGLGGIVGRLLTHAFMLINFSIRTPRRKLMFREIITLFLNGGIGKDYIDLLKESHMEPSWLDKVLYILGRIFECSSIGGVILVIIGLILK